MSEKNRTYYWTWIPPPVIGLGPPVITTTFQPVSALMLFVIILRDLINLLIFLQGSEQIRILNLVDLHLDRLRMLHTFGFRYWILRIHEDREDAPWRWDF
jgi:hypothetical protein